jgi:LysR family hydrogen peroxide-inducible transcriptional activator
LNITLTQFKYAVAVEKNRSFRQAAMECHVTQPTLSMQLQKLEDHLGVQLFDRSTQPITVTPMGSQILGQIRVVLNHTQMIAELIQEAKTTIGGDLRLAIIPTLSPYLLPLFLGPLTKTYPEIQLNLYELKTSEIIAQLESNQLDMGLLVTPLGIPSIREIPLFDEPFYVFAHQESTLSRLDQVDDSNLSQENLLLLAEGHCMRDQMKKICHIHDLQQHGQARTLNFESSSIETLCHLVLNGLGYTLIPHLALPWMSGDAFSGGKIIPFKDPIPTRQISLVVHQSFVREALLKAVKTRILASLPSYFSDRSTS